MNIAENGDRMNGAFDPSPENQASFAGVSSVSKSTFNYLTDFEKLL